MVENIDTIRRRTFSEVDPLSDDALYHLKAYKYSSVDKSWISNHILRHYWNAFVELLPLSLAPNLVTLLGFGCILINILFLWLFIPDLVGPGPSWVYFSFALGLWMYSTMDNVDGKQARRTGQSSPLGELFDHGIDSLNCTLGSILECAAMGFGSTKLGAFTALIPCAPMFFSTWETYYTHTLYLGYFNGPTEGLIIACLLMATSGIFGPQIWRHPLSELFGMEELLGDTTLIDLWVPIVGSSFFIAHLPACIYNVVQARKKAKQPILPVFYDWIPMVVFTFSSLSWLYSPHSTILSHNHLLLFCLTLSFVIGRMTTKIILCHLTRRPFPYWTVMLVPLMVGAMIGNLPYLGMKAVHPTVELWYLRGFFVFAAVAYFSWAVTTINKICAFLDINCLTIKHPKQPQQAGQKVNGAVGPAAKRSS